GHAKRSVPCHPEAPARVFGISHPIEEQAVFKARLDDQSSDVPVPNVAVGLLEEGAQGVGLLTIDPPVDAGHEHSVRSDLVGQYDPAFSKGNLLGLHVEVHALIKESTNAAVADHPVREWYKLEVDGEEISRDPAQPGQLLAAAERPRQLVDALDPLCRVGAGNNSAADSRSKPAPAPDIKALGLQPEPASEASLEIVSKSLRVGDLKSGRTTTKMVMEVCADIRIVL